MKSIKGIVREGLLQEGGIRDINKLSDRYDKAKIYFHQDLDGIASALSMKYYLENNGIRVVDSEVIQYGGKEFAVKKMDAEGDVMPVLVDFAHGKRMFVIHTDHHDSQVGADSTSATSFRQARSNVETISQIISPSDAFPTHDIMMISTVDSADFVKQGVSPDDVMNFIFKLDKEGELEKNKKALALATNKLLLSYKNKPDFLEKLVMDSTPSLLNIYRNIKKIAGEMGYASPEDMTQNQADYVKAQKDNKDVQFDDHYGIIKQYGGGSMFKPGSYDRYTPFKNNPDANFLVIAWPMGLLQASCNPFQESRSLKGVNLGEIAQEVLGKFESELRGKELTLDSMKWFSEKDKSFNAETSVGFTYHDFIEMYGDSAVALDKETGEDVLIKSYGQKTQDVIKDIISKPYSNMTNQDRMVAKRMRVSLWDAIQANSGGHKCITNISGLIYLGKDAKDLLLRLQNEFVETLKDRIDGDSGGSTPSRNRPSVTIDEPKSDKPVLPTKTGYNEEDKTMTYEYEIINDNAEWVEIENVQTFPMVRGGNPIGQFGSGPDSKLYAEKTTSRVRLPKSQISIGETDENNMALVTIPYWLFKENMKDLKQRKIRDWSKYVVRE